MILAMLSLLGCAPTPAPAPEESPDVATGRLAAAQAAIGQLATTVRGRMQSVMAERGPLAAVEVCAGEAQAMSAKVAAESGVRVGRSSLRLRNPANQAPPWVAEWLTAQGERPGAGSEGFARVEGGVAQVLKPVVVEAPCLTCHGPIDQIPPDVRAVLAERYPADAATGYAVGDLRGAVWAER